MLKIRLPVCVSQAVRNDGFSIRYVKEPLCQNGEICLEAVRMIGSIVRNVGGILIHIKNIDYKLLAYLMTLKDVNWIRELIIERSMKIDVFMNALMCSSDSVRNAYAC